MVRVASCFAQVLNLVDRAAFARTVRDQRADFAAKGFTCWDQFVAMLFCQLGSADSLREICGGLATALGKVVHLGLNAAPKRSTLAYANEHRPWQVYQGVFFDVLARCQSLAASRRRKFRFKNPLLMLDSTVIDLCLDVFDWARFRRTKGAIKLHLLLDHQGCLPCWALVTEGRTHDVRVAQQMAFAPGAIVVMDKAYTDYRLFARWSRQKVFFVTRMRANALCQVVAQQTDSVKGNIRADEFVEFTGPHAQARCSEVFRRITVWDEVNQREIVLLTNLFHLSARTVASLYKERWRVELFFKALKQNLKVKTFVGTTENAVKTQIWTALVAILLLKFLQLKATWAWSLSNLAALLRMNLLTYRDLWAWLEDPYGVPIVEPSAQQLTLAI